ncbi:hypothetical protein T484DRAFT_1887444, partial [Baffinella frigidus]
MARTKTRMPNSPEGAKVAEAPPPAAVQVKPEEIEPVPSAATTPPRRSWKAGKADMREGGAWTVGRTVRVWWDGEQRWFEGIVLSYNNNPHRIDSHGNVGNIHRVVYQDGIYDENLLHSTWELDTREGAFGLEVPIPMDAGLQVPHGRFIKAEELAPPVGSSDRITSYP